MYKWKENMGDILGGKYEDVCRDVITGLMGFMDDNPDLKPKIAKYRQKNEKGEYEMSHETNEDGQKMIDVMDKAIGKKVADIHKERVRCAAITAVFWIKEKSWDDFCDYMRRKKNKEI